MKKRIISILLVILLAVSLVTIPASAEEGSAAGGEQYQTVFIHGLFGFGYNDAINSLLPYWGMTSGSMLAYLRGLGYDVVDASIGPMASCHDRCCELFAQLTGTVTDYGAAHSAAVAAAYANPSNDLKHDRYGRDYTGKAIVKDWGPIYENGKVTGWYDNKLNLVGHSFGGPTEVQFLQYLAEGDQNEINWGKEQAALYGGDWHDYVSPLFWGDYDGEYLINSVTSLAGVLNGTTFLDVCKDEGEFVCGLAMYIANTLGLTDAAYIYDFQLEHFGITKTPGQQLTPEQFFSSAKVQNFLAGYDNAIYDLSVAGCNDLKQGWDTYDNIYYFSYAGYQTYRDPFTGNYLPEADMMPLMLTFAAKMGSYNYSFEQIKDIHGNAAGSPDKSWQPNDGLVNTVSARYPIGAAQKEYDPANIEKGIWQWQDINYDHLDFCGGLLDPRIISMPTEARRFYKDIMSNIECCIPVEKPVDPVDPPEPPVPEELPFKDVEKDRWSYEYIKTMYELGVISGKTADTFDPTGYVTRGQFVKMLGALAGIDKAKYSECGFADVNSTSPFAPYIQWASENGIVYGYADNCFRPNEKITRQQIAAILLRFCKAENIELTAIYAAEIFVDESDIASYARVAVHNLQQAGVINGYKDGTFRPTANTTREQACVLLCGVYKLM